jgi:hypothetical protein
MTRSQRRWHAYIWLTLEPLIVIGLLTALPARPPMPIPSEKHATAERIGAGVAAAQSLVGEGRP